MGPGGVGLGGATRLSSTLGARTPAKRAGSSDAAVQARLGKGPHGVPRGCQLSSQSCNGGSLEAQLSDRPADRPRPQTRPGSTHRVVLLNESHDPAGGFAAYRSAFVPSDPHRDPGPGRVDHLHHHTPVTLSNYPTTRAASTAITGLYVEHQSIWGTSHAHQMEALQTDQQITPITTIKRHRAAAGRVRHHPRTFEDSGGRSPLIIKDLDLYPQPPTNTRSPTLNSKEPVFQGVYCQTGLHPRAHRISYDPTGERVLDRAEVELPSSVTCSVMSVSHTSFTSTAVKSR